MSAARQSGPPPSLKTASSPLYLANSNLSNPNGVVVRVDAPFCWKLLLTDITVDLLATVSQGSSDAFPVTDLDILDRSLETVSSMLDRVLAYVRSVLAGEVKGDAAVGRYLMDTFGASTEELDKGSFNTSLQVRVEYCVHDMR